MSQALFLPKTKLCPTPCSIVKHPGSSRFATGVAFCDTAQQGSRRAAVEIGLPPSENEDVKWIELALPGDADWEHLRARPEHAPAPLAASWHRALLAGADDRGPTEVPVLPSTTLGEHRDRLAPVLSVLDDALASTLSVFESSDYALLLADQNGVVVDQRAGGRFREHARDLRLRPGAVWDEASRGTNAIGTALAEELAVTVHGAAHLARPNHGLVCYAAPIHDPWGHVLGVLDATSFRDRAHPFVRIAVQSAVSRIEEALRLSCIAGSRRTLVERLLGRLRDPALLVSLDGRITHANRQALAHDLPLGDARPLSTDVFRVAAHIRSALDLSPVDLEALGRGQIRRSGLEVEPVYATEGRTVAWVVVLPQPAPRAVWPTAAGFSTVSGSDPRVVAVRAHATKLAPSTLPVLLLGETGTGKELLARGLHDSSARADGPFVAVNCAAFTPSLLSSELFGYGPGAFTGADPAGRDGRIVAAEGGTLVLDEVGDMPMPLQCLLLRFLEDGTYRRVGESSLRTADVRVLCSTSRDLPRLVDEGHFRADLYYRIRGATLCLPPLRERLDKLELAERLTRTLCAELGLSTCPTLSEGTRTCIQTSPWPGNIRELRMALHHGLVMAQGSTTIEPWHLPSLTPSSDATPAPTIAPPSLADAEEQALRAALREADGNVSAAARALGVARSTVYRMMRRYGLS